MYNNKKRVVILAALMVLLFAGQVMAQTTVLGFQLGKSTYDEVKANLPKGVKVKTEGAYENCGSGITTDGTGYGIEGLLGVGFSFDKKQTLQFVGMFFEGQRLNDINKILSSKYRLVRSYPGAWLLFKASHDYIYLYLPLNENNVVQYMTGALYCQEQLAIRQTIEDHKALERCEKQEEKKRLKKESEKF